MLLFKNISLILYHKINAIQCDLQISEPTLLISHLVNLIHFGSDKLYCQLLHRTFFLFLHPVICILIELKHTVFLSASF